MPDQNRRFLLKARPTGRVGREHFDLVSEPVPEIGAGEALIRTLYVSLDPTNRIWMSDVPQYMPPVAIGEVMRGVGVGRVVASRSDQYPEGALVQGFTNWQDYAVASPQMGFMQVPDGLPVGPSALLGVLGTTGLTAYFGVTDVAPVKAGDTFVVSAAAGGVGSVAGQIAKLRGARVVGLAGSDEKCAWVVEDLGFDACVNYKADDWRERLRAACPDGIDVDFENVGGEIMDEVFSQLNLNSRVALCGLISGYNEPGAPTGPRNFAQLLMRRVTLRGFIILDYAARFEEGVTQLAQWVAAGRLKHAETVVEGLEELPVAINILFDGGNRGKLVVKVADEG